MKKKDMVRNTNKKGERLISAFIWAALVILLFFATLLCFLFFSEKGPDEILRDKYVYLVYVVVIGVAVLVYLLSSRGNSQKLVMKENDLDDADWMTKKELKKSKEFSLYSFKKASRQTDGLVLGAKKKGKSVEVTTTNQLHALIVGTTGSGKTTGFVDQNIAILSSTAAKPSMLITDPKKELCEKHTPSLLSRGYNVVVLDLREPYTSSRWNPMGVLISRIRRIKNLKDVKQENGKYVTKDATYNSLDEVKTERQKLLDELMENATDLIYTLCPIRNKEQPNWEDGARKFILGFLMAMCEDCIAGMIDEDKMVLFNLYHNITKYCSEDMTVMKKYLFEGRDEFSKVPGLVKTVTVTTEKTLTSYLSEVNSYLQQLADDGILSMTSCDEINIFSMDETPTALFVVIPDEKVTRHNFVTLFISQVYKELVEKANQNYISKRTKEVTLMRHVHFLLDEFGNLPKFDHIDNMITVARSRGVRFLFVLQSFTQLKAKYGQDLAGIIKDNCNVKVFIGTDDYDTRKDFSELCGQQKIKTLSVSSSDSGVSSSTGAQNKPLISAAMLEKLNGEDKGNVIVSVRGYSPIWAYMTPSYELASLYFPQGRTDVVGQARLFDKYALLYDVGGGMEMPVLPTEEEERLAQYDEEERELEEKERLLFSEGNEIILEWETISSALRERAKELSLQLKDLDAAYILNQPITDIGPYLFGIADKYGGELHKEILTFAYDLKDEAYPRLKELSERYQRCQV